MNCQMEHHMLLHILKLCVQAKISHFNFKCFGLALHPSINISSGNNPQKTVAFKSYNLQLHNKGSHHSCQDPIVGYYQGVKALKTTPALMCLTITPCQRYAKKK